MPSLSGGTSVAIAYLAILTTLQMVLANQALDTKDTTPYKKRANTETAGGLPAAPPKRGSAPAACPCS